jgi:hypothetical protein
MVEMTGSRSYEAGGQGDEERSATPLYPQRLMLVLVVTTWVASLLAILMLR